MSDSRIEMNSDLLQLYRVAQGTIDAGCACGDIRTLGDIALKLDSPLQMSWTVSRKCNFTCPHCFNNSGRDHSGYEPPREPIIESIVDARPFNVCLCGGEPLTWDDLGSITTRLRDGGILRVSAVTNAYLATRDRLQRAADEGLNTIQISFDGVSPEEMAWYRPNPGSFEHAYRAIRDAVNTRGLASVAVSWLPNRFNVRSFPECVRMLCEIGVQQIRVQPLMSCGRAGDSYDQLRPSSEQYLVLQMMIQQLNTELMPLYSGTQPIQWGDPLEHIWFFTQTSAAPQQLSIQSNGWYEMSPYIPVLFGDAVKHSVREFWRKPSKEMWLIPIMLEYADSLQILDGMRSISPRIYFEDHVMIDRFDDDNWALAQETSDAQALISYARSKGMYSRKEN